MATQETEKHYRIIVLLSKCGTKTTRRLLCRHIIDSSPSGHLPFPWTLDNFLSHNQQSILFFPNGKPRHILDKHKRLIFPTDGRLPATQPTDIEEWDLLLLCNLLIDSCKPSPTTKLDLKILKKVRNKVCHTKDASLSDEKYDEYAETIEVILDRFLILINDNDLTDEVHKQIKDVKDGALSRLESSIQTLDEWHKSQKDISNQIERLQENVEAQYKDVKEIKELLVKHFTISVPDTKLVMVVKNCNSEQEEFICRKLIGLVNPILQPLEDATKDAITLAMQEAMKKMLSEDIQLQTVKQECISFYLKCPSLSRLLDLWMQCTKGKLTKAFQPVEECIRSSVGFKNIRLQVKLPEKEFIRCLNLLVTEIVRKTGSTYVHATFVDRNNGKYDHSDNQGTAIEMDIKPTSISQWKRILQNVETGGFTDDLQSVAVAFKDCHGIDDVLINAHLVRENKFQSSVSAIKEERYDANVDVKLEGTQAEITIKGERDDGNVDVKSERKQAVSAIKEGRDDTTAAVKSEIIQAVSAINEQRDDATVAVKSETDKVIVASVAAVLKVEEEATSRFKISHDQKKKASTVYERTLIESLKAIIKEQEKEGVYEYLPKKRNNDSHKTNPRHGGTTHVPKYNSVINGEMKAESITIGDNNVQLVYKDDDSRINKPTITNIGNNNIVLNVTSTPYQLRDETGHVLKGLAEVDVLVRRIKECMLPNSRFNKFNESIPKQYSKPNIPTSSEYWTPANSLSSNCSTSDIPTKGPYSYAKTDDVKRWTRQEPTENSCHRSTCSSKTRSGMENFDDEPIYSTAKAIDEDTISLKLKADNHPTSLDDVLNEKDVQKFMNKAYGSKYAVDIFPYINDFGYIPGAHIPPPTYDAPVLPEPPAKERSLEDCEWYHGDIDAHEANGRLRQSKDHGSFLVRLPSRSSISHKYTLSFLDEAKIKHLKLNETNGKYHFEDSKEDKDKFNTVVDMMDTLRRTKMEIQDETTQGWKFIKLLPVPKH